MLIWIDKRIDLIWRAFEKGVFVRVRHYPERTLLCPMICLSQLPSFSWEYTRNIIFVFFRVLLPKSNELKNLSATHASLQGTFSEKEIHHFMAFKIVFIRVTWATYKSKRDIVGEDEMGIIYSSKVLIWDLIWVLESVGFECIVGLNCNLFLSDRLKCKIGSCESTPIFSCWFYLILDNRSWFLKEVL